MIIGEILSLSPWSNIKNTRGYPRRGRKGSTWTAYSAPTTQIPSVPAGLSTPRLSLRVPVCFICRRRAPFRLCIPIRASVQDFTPACFSRSSPAREGWSMEVSSMNFGPETVCSSTAESPTAMKRECRTAASQSSPASGPCNGAIFTARI